MKKAKEHTTKTLSVLLAVVMLVCAVPLTASAHSYSSDYRKWSQGGSSYDLVRKYGCWVVAMSKLIYEANIDRSSTFNPDVFAKWEVENGLVPNLTDNLLQNNGGEAPKIYAEQHGRDLLYYDGWSNTDDQIMWNTTEAGYYTIVQVSENNFKTSHYVMIDNELTKATGQLYCYDSFITTGEIDSQPLSRYPYRGSIYVYSAYNPDGSLTSHQVGDIIPFGSYPQSRETSPLTILSLNDIATDWHSYGYYSGSGSVEDGQMAVTDFMEYCDITYNDKKYRGVRFTKYRPTSTGYPLYEEGGVSLQDDNGYTIGCNYWFKYEPLQWQVLDPSTGLIMCVSIIDSQPFNNFLLTEVILPYYYYWGNAEKTHNASDYIQSSLRKWLNESFYNIAFTEDSKKQIAVNWNMNSDRIFLLSYTDILNPNYGSNYNPDYGFSQWRDIAARGTDYAQSQGLGVYRGTDYNLMGLSSFWLQTSTYNRDAHSFMWGSPGSNYVNCTSIGVRPVCKITDQPAPSHIHTPAKAVKENVVAETTEHGGSYDEVVYCSVCFAELSRKTVNTDPLPPQEESEQTKPSVPLSPFQIIIQWFRNLFDKLFGWMKR